MGAKFVSLAVGQMSGARKGMGWVGSKPRPISPLEGLAGSGERGGDILYLAQEEVPQIPPIRFHPVLGPSQLCVQISPLVS